MSDLISRSALLKKIAEEYDLNYGEILINPERFYEMVETVPTAYDVDKVEEQLDEYITKIVGRKSALYQTIMRIVRKGGVE